MISELLNNKNIVRNKLKINASINNSKIFKSIIEEYGSFYNYLKTFTNGNIFYEVGKDNSSLSLAISKAVSSLVSPYILSISVPLSLHNEI